MRESGLSSQLLKEMWARSPQTLLFALIAALMLGVLLTLILTYPSANRGDDLRAKLHDQGQHSRALEREVELLNLKITEANKGSELLREDLLAARRKLSETERDVTFYKGLLSPEEPERGFKLHTVSLFETDQANIYEYEVVVAHVDGRGKKVAGDLRIRLDPIVGAFPEALEMDVAQPDAEPQLIVYKGEIEHRLGFRFFQRVSGRIKLPDNYEPATIILAGSSNIKRGSNAFEQYFDWSALLASTQAEMNPS